MSGAIYEVGEHVLFNFENGVSSIGEILSIEGEALKLYFVMVNGTLEQTLIDQLCPITVDVDALVSI